MEDVDMVTNKTYGYPIGYMKTGRKAHLVKADGKALCGSRGIAARYLSYEEGVDYEVFCAACLQERNRKVLGAAYTKQQRDMGCRMRDTYRNAWSQQDEILRRFR